MHFLIRFSAAARRPGANYEEADDGSSDRDVLAKRRITLRELKETRFRLLVLRRTGLMIPPQDRVIQEALELKLIVAKLVRNSEATLKKKQRKKPARTP